MTLASKLTKQQSSLSWQRFNFHLFCVSCSMGNCLRFLKMKIAKIKDDTPEDVAKEYLIGQIESFIQERIEFADRVRYPPPIPPSSHPPPVA